MPKYKSTPFITEEAEPVLPADEEILRRAVTTAAQLRMRTTASDGLLLLGKHMFEEPVDDRAIVNRFLNTVEAAAVITGDTLAKRNCKQASRFRECANTMLLLKRILNSPPADIKPNEWSHAVLLVAWVTMVGYVPVEDWAIAFPLAATSAVGYGMTFASFERLFGASNPVALADAVAHILAPDVETAVIDKRFETARKPLSKRRLKQQFVRFLALEHALEKMNEKHPLASALETLVADLPEDEPSPVELAPSNEPDPLEVVADEDAVNRALARLGKRTADLLRLMMEGKSASEAAEELGISPSTARTLLERARKQFSRTP
ncbi:MAG: hypothetical protein KatS3mg022_2545 [Armatimonadota bacterium]|nr:MAG: hypothetical protein KatS3mg022_2545 [Armatimonadota bacterium]GIV18712.1 MAG: hypothetical protein KatS3mg023_0463 [Armatimonadota bacterium]